MLPSLTRSAASSSRSWRALNARRGLPLSATPWLLNRVTVFEMPITFWILPLAVVTGPACLSPFSPPSSSSPGCADGSSSAAVRSALSPAAAILRAIASAAPLGKWPCSVSILIISRSSVVAEGPSGPSIFCVSRFNRSVQSSVPSAGAGMSILGALGSATSASTWRPSAARSSLISPSEISSGITGPWDSPNISTSSSESMEKRRSRMLRSRMRLRSSLARVRLSSEKLRPCTEAAARLLSAALTWALRLPPPRSTWTAMVKWMLTPTWTPTERMRSSSPSSCLRSSSFFLRSTSRFSFVCMFLRRRPSSFWSSLTRRSAIVAIRFLILTGLASKASGSIEAEPPESPPNGLSRSAGSCDETKRFSKLASFSGSGSLPIMGTTPPCCTIPFSSNAASVSRNIDSQICAGVGPVGDGSRGPGAAWTNSPFSPMMIVGDDSFFSRGFFTRFVESLVFPGFSRISISTPMAWRTRSMYLLMRMTIVSAVSSRLS
eukprot:comp22356_c0_seq1/m.53966 comp22356_c0_seq1/g.53966  ORF comp22356_c0_seq1/g.53966 comp22356_c0_seq1/m.53966 type:complete len:492 (+) comp22356_c0_seq1:1471-2946(+)